jgi:hypothetical protein
MTSDGLTMHKTVCPNPCSLPDLGIKPSQEQHEAVMSVAWASQKDVWPGLVLHEAQISSNNVHLTL